MATDIEYLQYTSNSCFAKMSKLYSLLALTFFCALLLCCSCDLEVPRHENASVVAFMDLDHGVNDFAGDDDLRYTSSDAGLRTDIEGPFGDIDSCWGITNDYHSSNYMCSYYTRSNSWTIAFYFYSPATVELGPILWREDYFYVNYNKKDLEFKGMKSNDVVEQLSIVKNFIVPNDWTFIAFTDDNNDLKVYNEQGSVVQTLPSFSKYQSDEVYGSDLYLGRYKHSYPAVYMQETDAFACLYVYNDVLTGEEISQIPSSCKLKGRLPLETVWPQKQHLVGLWPLSSKYGSADVSGNELLPAQSTNVTAFTIGPQGNTETAAVATNADFPLIKIEGTNLAPTNGSFTIAMWFSPQSGKQSGALFEFLDNFGTSKAFQFHYNGSNIDISANGFLTGRFKMVQPSNTWTFIAVTLENLEKLKVFGDHGMAGQIEKCSACAKSMEFNNGGISLGHATRWGENIQVGDAVSCLAYYKTALNDLELRQVKDGCRTINFVSLSGQPRLPLSPIPEVSHPMEPKIPKYGQFPWVGSLQYNLDHVCSATIVNSLWILTSATCVSRNPTAYQYRFIAAAHDLELAYEQRQERYVKSISLSGNLPHDLALLQLTEPLNMTNDYIGDVFLARGDEMYTNWLKEQIFLGWGVNGRSELDSPTLPRYVVGAVLTGDQCETLWPEQYNATYYYCFRSLVEGQNVPCHEDEGSPLLVQTDGDSEVGIGERLLQVGVYRGRDALCSKIKPGLFTRTAPFAEWIASVVDRV